MALEIRLMCCGARPEPMVEAYVRARVKDLGAEFPEIQACRVALERAFESGWQIKMALVTDSETVFVREPQNAPRMDDCVNAVDRSLRAARRALAARTQEREAA